MIQIKNINQEIPYIIFKEKYNDALKANQKNIEAIAISSYNKKKDEVESRFVNLKLIENDKFIFFTNYNSPKSLNFKSHNQISGLFFWSSTNVQIRLKAKIEKTSFKFNQLYFEKRSPSKNALAISSKQSEEISSYEDIVKNYNEAYKKNDLIKCPKHWGGFSFVPYYFEFWEGHEFRINRRLVFNKIDKGWEKLIIQP